MKRLIAAIIDVFLCFISTGILRFIFAAVQKNLISAEGLYKDARYYVPDAWIYGIFLTVIIFYSIFFNKNRISIGKKIMGIKLEEKSGKIWNILHIFFRITAVIFSPLMLLYYLVTGEMPYDSLLSIHVIDKSKKVYSKRGNILSFNILIFILSTGSFLYKYIEPCREVIQFYLLLPPIVLASTGTLAGLYIAAIDLPIQNIGEEALRQGDGGDACEYIFSEEGEKQAWGIVIKDKEEYMKECVINGYGLEELKEFDFYNNFLVCTYGRKLAAVRILPGMYESELPPFLVLNSGFESHTVYYYRIPKIAVKYSYEAYHHTDALPLMVESTNYLMLRNNEAVLPLIEAKGPLERWIWVFRCKMLFDLS